MGIIGETETTEEMKQQEAAMLGEETAWQQEGAMPGEGMQDAVGQEESTELAEVQKTNIIDMSAKEAGGQGSRNYTHTFKTPVFILGKQYKALTFYFEKLTGADIEAVEQEMMDMNKYALTPEISSTFQCMLAARAAGVGSDEIRRLPVADYMKIKNKARDFLTGVGY